MGDEGCILNAPLLIDVNHSPHHLLRADVTATANITVGCLEAEVLHNRALRNGKTKAAAARLRYAGQITFTCKPTAVCPGVNDPL